MTFKYKKQLKYLLLLRVLRRLFFKFPKRKGEKMALNNSFILDSLLNFNHLCNTKYMCVYIYIYIYTHTHIYVYKLSSGGLSFTELM